MSTPPITCPSCGDAVILEAHLREDSVDQYDFSIEGHEQCDRQRLQAVVRRHLKTPHVAKPKDPAKQKQGKRNRHNGYRYEHEWELFIGGRRIAFPGSEDVMDDTFSYEVKGGHVLSLMAAGKSLLPAGGAFEHARKVGRVPAVARRLTINKRVKWFVLLEAEDFREILRELQMRRSHD